MNMEHLKKLIEKNKNLKNRIRSFIKKNEASNKNSQENKNNTH